MPALLDWKAARDRVVDAVTPLAAGLVRTVEARGLALAADVIAPESLPAFANSGMDGFAVRAADTAGASAAAPVELKVLATLAAGAGEGPAVAPGTAVRIMTGAPIPEGADAVVPVEWTEFWDADRARSRPPRGPAEASAVHLRRPITAGGNVRPAGESVREGATCLERGQVVGSAAVSLLLALGLTEVGVHPRPRVALLATGDELVDPEVSPGPGQIRDSSRGGLLARIAEAGFTPVDAGRAADDEAELEARIREGAARADFLLTTGGVSVGDFDLTRRVLDRLGRVEAYRVAVKPGKPQLFGTVEGIPVFGLPGNPVSSFVVFDVFVQPALRKLAGRRDLEPPLFPAILGAPLTRRPGRTEFLRVRLSAGDTGWIATPTGPQGSGILTSLTRADGYALIPAEAERLPAGAAVLCRFPA